MKGGGSWGNSYNRVDVNLLSLAESALQKCLYIYAKKEEAMDDAI